VFICVAAISHVVGLGLLPLGRQSSTSVSYFICFIFDHSFLILIHSATVPDTETACCWGRRTLALKPRVYTTAKIRRLINSCPY